MSSLIEPGKKAPAFTLKDQQGEPHRLSDYTGKPVVLYFYPKDDTPGCTQETCEFQDALPRFKSGKAAMIINGDWSWADYLAAPGIDVPDAQQ